MYQHDHAPPLDGVVVAGGDWSESYRKGLIAAVPRLGGLCCIVVSLNVHAVLYMQPNCMLTARSSSLHVTAIEIRHKVWGTALPAICSMTDYHTLRLRHRPSNECTSNIIMDPRVYLPALAAAVVPTASL